MALSSLKYVFVSNNHQFYIWYSSNLLTPTWPLCKNILSVDYERSIRLRKCNRWKSFEIVHVCLNNKNAIIFNTITMLDSDGLLEGWASTACESRWFEHQQISFSIIILVKSNRHWVEWQGKVKHWVSRAISLILWIKCKSFTFMVKLKVQSILYMCTLDMTDKAFSKRLNSKAKEIVYNVSEHTHTKYLNQKMDKCETRTTILSNLFHVITKSDTYALLIRLSSISTNRCSN